MQDVIRANGHTWTRSEKAIAQIDQELRSASDMALERYAGALDLEMTSGFPFEAWPESQQRAMRAGNERARRQNEAQRQVKKAAEERAAQERHDAAVTAEVEEFKDRARAAFPGTAAEFAAEWPALKAEWQRQQTLARLGATEAANRARLMDF